jgi:KDO2-lipid IV(A) lauroyltransferase
MKKLLVTIIYIIEAFFLCLWIITCRLIGIDLSSKLGSIILKFIGPITKFDKRATYNINKIYPDLDLAEHKNLKKEMWDNLGRNIGEFAFANKLNPYNTENINSIKNKPRFIIEGEKYLKEIYKTKKGVIFFSAHIGNWEICPLILSTKGLKVTSIYRHANNPINEKIIQWLRKGISIYSPKGPSGAKTLFKVLRNKEYAAILADQKLNEGKIVNFLGHPAKTATAIAELSLKLSIPIVPIHVERIKGVQFKYIIEKPIYNLKKKCNHDEELNKLLEKINKIIGKWILKNPSQWLWIHNRW